MQNLLNIMNHFLNWSGDPLQRMIDTRSYENEIHTYNSDIKNHSD